MSVHDFQVWSITSGMGALSVACLPDASHAEGMDAIRELLRDRFGIDHVTIEAELLERQHGLMNA